MATHIINTTEPVRRAPNTRLTRREELVYRYTQATWLAIGIIETLLLFRFVFEITGANSANGFVNLIYALSHPFAAPFMGIFGITYIPRSFVDWSLIVAAVVYYLVGIGIVKLVQVFLPTPVHDQEIVE